MNIKQAWSALVSFVRKLPVARYIKPVWKAGIQLAIQQGGDELQKEAHRLLTSPKAAVALKAFDAAFDHAQAKLKSAVRALPLPQGVEAQVLEAIQAQGDVLQAAAREAVVTGSCTALDKAFDDFQAQLRRRVEAL